MDYIIVDKNLIFPKEEKLILKKFYLWKIFGIVIQVMILKD